MNALAFWVQDNVLMKKSDKAKKNESDSEVKPQDEVFLGSVDNSIGNSLLWCILIHYLNYLDIISNIHLIFWDISK